MRKVINCTLGTIAEALNEIEQYKAQFDPKLKEFCAKLATIGATVASIHFTRALYDGINDSKIRVEPTDTGYKIIAEGNAVAFIEFGAGVHYPDIHPKAAELGIMHGTYGKGNGKNDYWWYTGQPGTAGGEFARDRYGREKSNSTITHGNPANMPMYYAAKEMQERVQEIAQEVFGR